MFLYGIGIRCVSDDASDWLYALYNQP